MPQAAPAALAAASYDPGPTTVSASNAPPPRSLIERTVSTYSPACTATSASRVAGAAWRRS